MDTLSMGKRACIYDDDFRAQILFSCGRPARRATEACIKLRNVVSISLVLLCTAIIVDYFILQKYNVFIEKPEIS